MKRLHMQLITIITIVLMILLVMTGCPGTTNDDTTPPAEVTNLAVINGDASVTLSWTEPSDDDFAGVHVYCAEKRCLTAEKGTVEGTITELSNGTEYTFIVKTYDATGNESEGITKKATPVAPSSSDKAITSFSFASPAVSGTINETTHTVAVTVPYGTTVTSLTPTIAYTGSSIAPASGTAQDFTNPITYTVTAEDGTTQEYVATVTVAERSSYTVTYSGNENTDGTIPVDDTTYYSDSTVTVLENSGKLKRTGYVFIGWNTLSTGTGESYHADDTFTMNAEDVTLYAAWIEASPASDFTYTTSDEKVTITKYIGNATSVVIPETLGGNPVITLNDATFSDSGSNITTLTFPSSFTTLNSVLYSTPNIEQIIISDDNTVYSSQDGVIFSKDKKMLGWYPLAKPETSYTVPDSVVVIGDYAFYQQKTVESLIIPDSVTSIRECSLGAMAKLSSVNIGNSLETIGNYAFSESNELTSIALPASVSSIGQAAFSACHKLASVTVASGNTNYTSEDGILYNTGRTTIVCYPPAKTATTYTLPSSIDDIAGGALCSCSYLTAISAGSNSNFTTTDGVLFNSDGTTLICYPSGKTGEDYAIPDGVTTIGYTAFSTLVHLQNLLTTSITSIETYAFYHCGTLNLYVDNTTPPSLGEDAFWDVWLNVYVPFEAVNTYKGADGWNEYEDSINGQSF